VPRPALLFAALAALVLSPANAAGRPVHLRGTAYEFNNVHVLLAGATIRVAEQPKLKATVRRDGTYDLAVPDRSRITPYIQAAGHHTIYLQTFRTAGENLANVNFQTPSDGVYRALVVLLGVPVDAAGNPRRCAIVSTFSTRNVRDLGFAGFIAYGAHGVAGATATTTPRLPRPTYFNAQVIPDPVQQLSSEDGGVLWTDVAAGLYTVRAHSPVTSFASFVATCRPGRIVNANPPWGLHELGLRNPARVTANWTVRARRFTLRSLRASALPAGARVTVRCSGRGCPFRSATKFANVAGSRMRAGQTVAVAVTAHAHDGALWRWRLAAGHRPQAVKLCIPLGNTAPRRHC
jgi:hypothetical protein